MHSEWVCSALLRLAFTGELELVVSKELLDEYRTVLLRPQIAERHRKPQSEVHELVDLIGELADTISLSEQIPRVVRDIDDDKFVACAVAGNADFIVSGDIHLLEMIAPAGVQVIRPHEALALLSE